MKTRIWNTMLLSLMLFCLVVAPGCGVLAKFQELGQKLEAAGPLLQEGIATGKKVIENGKKVVESGTKVVNDLTDMEEKARLEADTNKSGGLDSLSEWMTYIGLLVGGGGTVLGGGKVAKVMKARREEEFVNAVKKANGG